MGRVEVLRWGKCGRVNSYRTDLAIFYGILSTETPVEALRTDLRNGVRGRAMEHPNLVLNAVRSNAK